jgi:hypothetical protein
VNQGLIDKQLAECDREENYRQLLFDFRRIVWVVIPHFLNALDKIYRSHFNVSFVYTKLMKRNPVSPNH